MMVIKESKIISIWNRTKRYLRSRMTELLNSANPFVFFAIIYFMKLRLVYFFIIVGRLAEYNSEPNQTPHLPYLTWNQPPFSHRTVAAIQ
jgi:hypothetical protein